MYLRKIDYEILKMMREKAKDKNNPYYSRNQIANLLKEKGDVLNPDTVICYYSKLNLAIASQNEDKNLRFIGDSRCYALTPYGLAAIEEYEIEMRSKLVLPEESNKLSLEANKISGKANKLSIAAIVMSAISLVLTAVSFFVK